ncbi:MAG: tetratricopeptide repeat protein [bacterium]
MRKLERVRKALMLGLLVWCSAAAGLAWAAEQAAEPVPEKTAAPAGGATAKDSGRLLEQLEQDLASVDQAIDGTKKLIEQSMHRPYLPDLYMRLAELYIARSRILYHKKRVEDPQASKAVVVLEANLLKTKAVDLYAKVLEEFPQYAHPDKALFFMAHEYRELGQFDKMLACYTDLTKRYPQSPYRLEGYLMIGDHNFDAMDLDKAEECYRTILAAPESHVHGMARYKMAWCHINRNRYPEAVELLETLVADPRYDDLKTDIDAYKKLNLRREALMDLAYCYTEVRKPEEALDYFARLSDSKSVYIAVLEKLGQRYFLKEDWSSAARVYARILSLTRDTGKTPGYAEKLFASAQKAGKLEEPAENVRVIVRTLADVEASWRISDEEKERWRKQLELYARDMATRLQLQAKEKKDKALASQAADAYKHYLAFFKEGEVSRDMLHNQAEALFQAGRYFEAAQAYEKLASVDSSAGGAPRKDFLYGAVVAYHRALKEEKELKDLKKMEARQALRQTGAAYLEAYPGGDEASEVAFNVAWVAYEQGDYGAALDGFKAFIRKYPQSKEARAAGHLVLDIRKSLDDLDGLVADARTLLEDRRLADPGFRKEVEGILMASERRKLEELTIQVKDGREGSDQALVELGRGAKDSGLRETALYNLFVVNKEAKKIPKVVEIGGQLLAAFPQSEHRGDVASTLAHYCFEAADFPNAAAWSEKAAEGAKGEEQGEHWLRAARLDGWMGDPVAAVNAYRKALPLLGPQKRLEAQKDLLSELQQMNDWPAAAALAATLAADEPGEVRWGCRQGDALRRQGRNAEAVEAFDRAIALYGRKASSPAALSPEEKSAAAEARFRRAEREMEAFRQVSLPGDAIDAGIVQKKMAALQSVEAASLEVAQCASPRWTIASLELAARANESIVDFFLRAPLPGDLNLEQKQQYVKLLEDKVQPYRDKARQVRQAALDKAYEVGIFCPEVLSCYAALNGGASPAAISRGRQQRRAPDGPSTKAILESLYADPGNPTLLASLGASYAAEGKLELAALVLHRLLEKTPNDARGHNLLGLVRLLQDKDAEAYASFRRALEISPDLAEAGANLVVLYAGYGNRREARATLDKLERRQAPAALDSQAVHPDFSAVTARLNAVARQP